MIPVAIVCFCAGLAAGLWLAATWVARPASAASLTRKKAGSLDLNPPR